MSAFWCWSLSPRRWSVPGACMASALATLTSSAPSTPSGGMHRPGEGPRPIPVRREDLLRRHQRPRPRRPVRARRPGPCRAARTTATASQPRSTRSPASPAAWCAAPMSTAGVAGTASFARAFRSRSPTPPAGRRSASGDRAEDEQVRFQARQRSRRSPRRSTPRNPSTSAAPPYNAPRRPPRGATGARPCTHRRRSSC
jgi:hypothetical protein